MTSQGPAVKTPLNGATIKQLHKCPKCDRTFPYIGHLKCHFYRVHPEFRLDSNELKPLDPKAEEKSKTLVLSEAPSAFSTQFTFVSPDENDNSKDNSEESCDSPDEEMEEDETILPNKTSNKIVLVKETPSSNNDAPAKPTIDIQKASLRCEACKKIFTNKASYEKHCLTSHADIRYFMCSQCDKSFPTAARLKAHEKTHRPASIPCAECRKHPSKTPHKCPHKKPLFNCDVCDKKFNTLALWNAHQAFCKPESGKHQCSVCDKVFARKNALNEHLLVHESYTCTLCDASFQREDLLKLHSLTHNPSYECAKCGETFSRKNHLIRHEQTHA